MSQAQRVLQALRELRERQAHPEQLAKRVQQEMQAQPEQQERLGSVLLALLAAAVVWAQLAQLALKASQVQRGHWAGELA